MKILVISQGLVAKRGGAESSLLTLVSHLSKTHEVTVVSAESDQKSGSPLPSAVRFVPVASPRLRFRSRWLKTLQARVQFLQATKHLHRRARETEHRLRPNLIICQKPPLPYASCDTPVCTFVRDLEFITYFGLTAPRTLEDRADRAVRRLIGSRMLQELLRSALVISNSDYTRSVLARFGVHSTPIPPFMSLPDGRLESAGISGEVLYLSAVLAPHKGVKVFIELAKRLPAVHFLAVGRDTHGYAQCFPPNVEWKPWLDDPASVYRRTAVLLVPSQWPETFGRVVIEAQAYGIPVLASHVGALPETVGAGGETISPPESADHWERALTAFLEDPARYAVLAAEARANAKTYSLQDLLSRCEVALGAVGSVR